jgi:YD repeat-containing protein
MPRALTFVLTAFIIATATATTLCSQETRDAAMKSEREQRDLRGPVKICVEEVTYPAVSNPDGQQVPERKTLTTTEYDLQGHILSTQWRNSGGSGWISQYTYSPSGQLLHVSSGTEGQPSTEELYQYDDRGRLLQITNNGQPNNPVLFHYDQQGRKTKVQTSRPEDYRGNVAIAGDDPFTSFDRPPYMEGGGKATTIFDQHDRPIEVRIRDAQGDIVSRAERTYDAQGRITEEKIVFDDIATIIPASDRAEIQQTDGASLDDLREQLKQVLGKGSHSPSSIAFTYDEQGRIVRKTRRVFNMEFVTDITNNQQGDPLLEITRTTHDNGAPQEYSEAHYAYQYDSRGNWTEKTDSYTSTAGGTPITSLTARRTLTYF